MFPRGLIAAAVLVFCLVLRGGPAAAQQRPLTTEDPESIGAGRVLVEGGLDYAHDVDYTVSGLTGNLTSVPTLGLSIGVSSIAEVQIDGGLYNHLAITSKQPAPLSSLLTVTGDSTHDISDIVIGTKIRVVPEGEARPAFGFRFVTKLPNAKNETGLGLDTTDFYASVLIGKTIRSVRLVGNFGSGILGDPTNGQRQNDVLTYGLSIARAITQAAELVGEVNGRVNLRSDGPLPGSETRGLMRLGGRFTHGAVRWDAAVFLGLTDIDPSFGFTTGITYVFNAFTVP
jgi:hypothetical protein